MPSSPGALFVYLPFIVVAIFAGWLTLLILHHKTRIYPIYILKIVWTTFTILAFTWVVAMSFGESKEYIQRPAGPLSILVGEMQSDPVTKIKSLQGGYPSALAKYTGTSIGWVGAFILFLISLNGFFPKKEDQSTEQLRFSQILTLGLFYFGFIALLLAMTTVRSTLFFLFAAGVPFALSLIRPHFFNSIRIHLNYIFICLLLLPLLDPIFNFDWSRYSHFKENYQEAWNKAHIGDYFINSLIVAITTVSLTTLIGSMASYVIARKNLVGKNLVYFFMIIGISIPAILIQIPLFLMIKNWGFELHQGAQFSFMDSRLGLSVIYTAISLPFTIFVMTGFYRSLPGTLEQAAAVDGCGPFKTFTRIYLPLSIPGIATTGIFNFLGVWNEFNLGMIFMSNPNFKTLPIGLYELNISTQYSSAWAPLFAGIVLLCLPTFLIFVFLQEKIVEGLTAGGVKG